MHLELAEILISGRKWVLVDGFNGVILQFSVTPNLIIERIEFTIKTSLIHSWPHFNQELSEIWKSNPKAKPKLLLLIN